MKDNGQSLEQQRQALLEQIHASRATYRRMLTGETEDTSATSNNAYAALSTDDTSQANATKKGTADDPAFPRSMTMHWIMNHPYYTAAAIVGVALLIPKTLKGTRRVSKKLSNKKHHKAAPHYASGNYSSATPPQNINQPGAYPQTIYVQQPSSPKTGALAGVAAFGGTALTSLITLATMVMRDPAKMQMAIKMFHTASHYLQDRKNRHISKASNQTPQ
jgi:hypothetical protein